jgi:hypothetical protein
MVITSSAVITANFLIMRAFCKRIHPFLKLWRNKYLTYRGGCHAAVQFLMDCYSTIESTFLPGISAHKKSYPNAYQRNAIILIILYLYCETSGCFHCQWPKHSAG